MNSASAGKGDPYWYEWTVGLLKVVEMLTPESDIESVSFQTIGAKGWDDVVVRYRNARTVYFQVKHTRVGRSITFGDLVGANGNDSSLLGSLFSAWISMSLDSTKSRCVLFTNKASGEAAGRSDAGVYRPPLFDFMTWLSEELRRVRTLQRCTPPNKWVAAWEEWTTQLKAGTPDQQITFLKSFELHANQPDLVSLETTLLTALSEAFQIPAARAVPLLQSLDSALRKWTTTTEKVTAEDAASAMALDAEPEVEHRAPPPPTPFFPSRRVVLKEIEASLSDTQGSPVLFLSSEPGSGKTSLISELANRRASKPLEGLVGLRYFAFRPITPESPLIPADADHFVRADRLWFTLLSQLRQGLRGKLRAYQVPLRNSLLSWHEARAHVLRIAARLGGELKRPFVLVIDGIDHAARAVRYEGASAKEFFGSLPSPDEIGGSPVRLVLAGQPPEGYPEYPVWLRTTNPRIRTLTLGNLDLDDIRVLLQQARISIPVEQENATIKLIEGATRGNTLAVVFAVEEARSSKSIDELQKRLAERHLQSGLKEYYRAIWSHTISLLPNLPLGTEVALASALCLTSERLTCAFMTSAFKRLGLSNEQWQMLLGSLGPLLVQDAGGFRVLHNDVRVFLHGHLTDQPLTSRRQGASMLADHYIGPSGDRWFAHISLLRLLRDAGRETEWARIFTVSWVFESAALGIPYADLSEDCAEALRQGTVLKDWDVMLELTCASETLGRWEEQCNLEKASERVRKNEYAPTYLHTESFVRPLTEWQVGDLHSLIHDTEILLSSNEAERARALLERWLGGLSVNDLCRTVPGLVEATGRGGHDGFSLTMGEHQTLESLGALCRAVRLNLLFTKPKGAVEREAQAHFETGWVQASSRLGPFDSLESCLANRPMVYLNSFQVALQKLALDERWPLIRSLLAHLAKHLDKFSAGFRAQCAWWALRSEAAEDNPELLEILSTRNFGVVQDGDGDIAPALAICQSLSWKDPAAEPTTIAQRVYDALQCGKQNRNAIHHYKLLFRAAATLGRVQSILLRRGSNGASAILPPLELTRLAAALWEYDFNSLEARKDSAYAGQLATDLVDVTFALSDQHRDALLAAAKPIADRCPVDHRRGSVWLVFQRSGNIPQLRAWLKRWFAEDGWLWIEDAGSRQSIAEDLLPLAREIGEADLARDVEERLRWLQIRYRGHKEYAFSTPISWFTELTRFAPTCWRDLGLKLWVLSEACSDLGGDDRCSWELGEALGSAAWACGPGDVQKLFAAEYDRKRSEYWLYPLANRIVGGFREFLSRKPKLPWRDKIVGWCLAVGLSRWFNEESIKELSQLRAALRLTATDDLERSRIAEAIDKLTPGESKRNPHQDSGETGTSSVAPQNHELQEWLDRIGEAEEVSPRSAAILLRRTLSEQPRRFSGIAPTILAAVGVGGPYVWESHAHGSREAVFEIAQLVSDDLLWNLIAAAVNYARGDTAWWTQSVTRNLYLVLLARAAKHGTSTLHSGLNDLLKMHELWARGGRKQIELPTITLPDVDGVEKWADMAAWCLTCQLASRSAEIVESALVGIHALAAHEPRVIGHFFELANGDLWKQHWILNSAEVWAVQSPTELEQARNALECWLASGPLHLRIQAWLVLRQLALRLKKPPPAFPHPSPACESSQIVSGPIRGIMQSPSTQHGSIRFMDRHRSADLTIERVEYVTGFDLHQLRSTVAERLLKTKPEDISGEPWSVRVRCTGDTRCGSLESSLILDEAFDEFLRYSPLPTQLQGRFAQAYLGSEDPWTLRHTPLPDPNSSCWPTEDELRRFGQDQMGNREIRQRLYYLATQHGVSEEEIVLAARVQVFTWRDDYVFKFWWEEGSDESKSVSACSCPTTMSGRTFVLGFREYFEPQMKAGKRPLTFSVGGHQRLSLSFPEFIPTTMWQRDFGWQPSQECPLVWEKDGRPIARYECIHSKPRQSQSGHSRQPLLGRWLVKRSVWESLVMVKGPFRSRDDFEHYTGKMPE